MLEAISDTGPILHLQEIGELWSLSIFTHLIVPGLVTDELRAYGLDPTDLNVSGLTTSIATVDATHRERVLAQRAKSPIHPADADVFVLAQNADFQILVLTDDLALRRRLEANGATVVGTVGILVRAYKRNMFTRTRLEKAIDALFTNSTLHLSPAFQAYVREMIAALLSSQ